MHATAPMSGGSRWSTADFILHLGRPMAGGCVVSISRESGGAAARMGAIA
jgi:hypothetical protein